MKSVIIKVLSTRIRVMAIGIVPATVPELVKMNIAKLGSDNNSTTNGMTMIVGMTVM